LDVVEALPFTQDLVQLPALEFMRLLCDSVRLRELWVGAGFTLGHRREGTLVCLTEIGRDLGFQVHAVPPLVIGGRTVSSTLIRELIGQGQVEAAAWLLARRHHVDGIALPVERRKRSLGLTIVNIIVSSGWAVPASGAYVGSVQAGDRQWLATVHVESHRNKTPCRLEAMMPDFPDDCLAQPLQVGFIRRLRPGVQLRQVRSSMDRVLVQRQVLSPA
jgi:riboflavin kinase/FMN adenylyltransferase